MLTRIVFALKGLWQNRAALKAARANSIASLTALSNNLLEKQSIRCLVLDFDGVMAAHGSKEPLADVNDWLQSIQQKHDLKIFILSNKPTLERQEFFSQNFPKIQFITAKRKKPYPDGLEQIISLTQLKPYEHALVDDRLLTGGLACVLAGVQLIYITKPKANYKKRPIVESFFWLLRFIERLVVR